MRQKIPITMFMSPKMAMASAVAIKAKADLEGAIIIFATYCPEHKMGVMMFTNLNPDEDGVPVDGNAAFCVLQRLYEGQGIIFATASVDQEEEEKPSEPAQDFRH